MELKKLPFFLHVHWDPDAKELLKFARAMIVGFAVIGALVAWRKHELGTAALTLWGIGAALAVLSLVPGLGKYAYLAVYIPTGILGFVVSRVILTIIFLFFFVPIGLLLKLSGKDPLHSKRNAGGSEWIAHSGAPDRKSFYRQF